MARNDALKVPSSNSLGVLCHNTEKDGDEEPVPGWEKVQNTHALFLLSLQMKFLWNSVRKLSFLVRKPVLRCLDWEYCSVAGKLKIRSATMRVFDGL